MDHFLKVEGPLKWIHDISQDFKIPNEDSYRIPNIIKNKIFDDYRDSEKFSYHLPLLNKLVFVNFHVAAILIKAGDIEGAKISLKNAEKHFGKLVGDHSRVLLAVKYIRKSLLWSASEIKTKDPEDEVRSEWENLLKCKTSVATIEFFKATISLYMGVPINDVLEKFRGVIKMDPKYFLWHHYHYRLLRHKRILTMSKSKSTCILPSAEELEANSKPYTLRSSVLLNIYWKAICLKESLWDKSIEAPETESTVKWNSKDDEDYQMCLDMLRDALEIAKLMGRREWEETIELERAHVLMDLKFQNRRSVDEGRELLLSCPNKFPDSSKVHHQVAGLYYMRVIHISIALKNAMDKAKESFKLALDKDPTNFKLLKDFLDFLNFSTQSSFADYVYLFEMINKAVEIGRDNIEEQAELEILRGFITWIYNPEGCKRLRHYENAVKMWINTLKKYPGSRDMLLKYIRDPPFAKFNSFGAKVHTKIHHFFLVLQLAEERNEIEESEDGRDEEALKAIFSLWVLGDMEVPDAPPEPVEIEIAEKNLEKDKTGKYVAPHQRSSDDGFKVTRTRTQSVSDLDDN